MSVKRALFIVITDNPGGAERVASALAGELARHPEWQVHYHVATRREACSFTEAALPPEVTVSYGLFNHYGLAIATLPAHLVGRSYDFVFTTHVYTNALLSLLRRLRLISIGRLISRESTSVFDRFSGRKAARLKRLYKLYGAQDLVVAQTRYMAKHTLPWLSSAAANRLIVLPNPVDRTFIRKAVEQALGPAVRERLADKINVLFCGRLMDAKRPDRALQAFAKLIARLPGEPWHLVIVGFGILEADLQQQAMMLGLQNKVSFLGFQPNPYAIMTACQYGIISSDNEGFPNVALEMMTCGMRKIVMTPCAGDLEELSGVTVTESFAAAALADALAISHQEGEDRRTEYQEVISKRTTSAYLRALLDIDHSKIDTVRL